MTELADALLSEQQPSGVEQAEIPGSAEDAGGVTSQGASPVTEKPLSLRDQLNKSVESVRTEEAKRARAADGKFTKLEGAEKPATPAPEQNAQPEASKTEGPPSAWKTIWDNLSPEARAIAVRRETEVAKGFEEYRGKTAQLSEISQIFEPLRPVLQQQGITSDVQAVKALAQWEGQFRNPQTRVQAFHNLAQQYGVDLRSLVQNPSQPSLAQDIPEPLRPVIDQFGNIVQQVQNVEARFQNWENAQIADKLNAFAKDKPHYEKVRVIMGQLMTAGIVQPGDLDTAYQQATQLHPEVKAAIEAEKATKAAAELAKTNAEKAARARQAAVSPGPSRPPTGAVNGQGRQKSSSVKESLMRSIGELREGQRA